MTRGDGKGRNERPPEVPDELDPGESTLESFVARLHDEGLQAGREEAERLVREAREEASRIVERAGREAEELRRDAREHAERDLARARDELDLAARDAVLELAESLRGGLRAILRSSVEQELSDPALVRALLTEVVTAYAQDDARGDGEIEVRVSPTLAGDIETWALSELADGVAEGNGLALSPTLEAVGFEYGVGEGTVEVTVDAATELLMKLLTPRLREVVERAARDLPR